MSAETLQGGSSYEAPGLAGVLPDELPAPRSLIQSWLGRDRVLKLQRIVLATLMFTACPGDDIAAVAAAYIPELAKTAKDSSVDTNEILGLYWIHGRLEERQPQPSEFLEGDDLEDHHGHHH